jgi:hypothetical protein
MPGIMTVTADSIRHPVRVDKSDYRDRQLRDAHQPSGKEP